MEGLLQGKVAAITGSGWRMGRAACLAFARQGARIVAADLDLARAEAVAAQLRDQGGQAVACRYDPAAQASGDGLVAAAQEAFGRLDILVNNTGVAIRPRDRASPRRPARRTKPETARFYTVSVDGVETACRAAIRQFEAQGGGGAIVTADLVARLTDYGSVRHDPQGSAVAILTRKLALEAAEQGTRVNAFCPAGMPTGSEDDDEGSPEVPSVRPPTPLGCVVTAEACANAALFLASDLAATITGVSLPVDAGLAAAAAQRDENDRSV